MKTKCIIALCFCLQSVMAQPVYFGPNYLHRSSAGNCFFNYTLLDPAITGTNSGDNLIFTHVYGTPEGTHMSYMNNSHGLWFSGGDNTWSVFDETITIPFDVNLAFNVLKPEEMGSSFMHTVTTENSEYNLSYIDNPALNNNPDAIFFISKSWYNGIYDQSHVGIWYSGIMAKWCVYNEDYNNSLKVNSTYSIFIPDAGTSCFKHIATSAYYITTLDHPLLNGNPYARIFIAHDFTNVSGQTGYLDKELGVWYDGNSWNIYAEDQSELFNGATFNVLIISETPTSIREEQVRESAFILSPNPATDYVQIDFKCDPVQGQIPIILSSANGTEVLRDEAGYDNGTCRLDLTGVPSGLYLLTAVLPEGPVGKKLCIIH